MGALLSKYVPYLYKLDKIRLLSYCLLLLGSWTLYSFTIKPFLSPLRKIPGPGYNPIFGNVREAMVGEAMETSVKWVRKYGGIVHFYHLLGRERVLIASPEGLRHVLVTNEQNYDRQLGTNILGDLSKTVLGLIGTEHAAQRQLLNPLFTKEAIKSHLHVFQECVSDTIDLWHEKLSTANQCLIDMPDYFSRMTLDVFSKAVLGWDLDSLHQPDNEMAQAFQNFTSINTVSVAVTFPILGWLPLPSNKAFRKQRDATFKVRDLLSKLIDEHQSSAEDSEQLSKKTLLQRLLMARDVESGRQFSKEELIPQLAILMVAGHETTTWTLSWILLTLAQHPDVQDKVRREVLAQLPSSGDITMEHLDKLTYTYAVIKECQRLYPAAPSFVRMAIKDDKIEKYHIPAGTIVIIHFGAMMRNEDIWPDAAQFKPERFLQDTAPPLYNYLPFATGPHTCLGINFARMEVRLALAQLVRQFKFSAPPGLRFKRKLRVTLKSEPPIQLLVERIQ